MRTNKCNVTEVAHIRTNLENFGEGHERVFGRPEKQFCDTCDLRFYLCVCGKTFPVEKEEKVKGEKV